MNFIQHEKINQATNTNLVVENEKDNIIIGTEPTGHTGLPLQNI